jgi:protein-S-isoprenylcysteine O-methyltransferase Ste14
VSSVLRWLDMVVFAGFLGAAALTTPRSGSWYVGLVLAVAALIPWLVARLQLGRSFSVSAQARGLVTSGLYARVRHPVYVFGTLAWTGALVALLGSRGAVIAAIVAVVQLARIRREERVLAEAFGEEYEAYRQTTWF